jgi:fluoride ion exporter CrcB/FEX
MVRVVKSKWFWALAFGALFAASIDLWAWDWTEPSVMGLPYTILYIAVLETLLFALFVLFAKYYWTDEKEGV